MTLVFRFKSHIYFLIGERREDSLLFTSSFAPHLTFGRDTGWEMTPDIGGKCQRHWCTKPPGASILLHMFLSTSVSTCVYIFLSVKKCRSTIFVRCLCLYFCLVLCIPVTMTRPRSGEGKASTCQVPPRDPATPCVLLRLHIPTCKGHPVSHLFPYVVIYSLQNCYSSCIMNSELLYEEWIM